MPAGEPPAHAVWSGLNRAFNKSHGRSDPGPATPWCSCTAEPADVKASTGEAGAEPPGSLSETLERHPDMPGFDPDDLREGPVQVLGHLPLGRSRGFTVSFDPKAAHTREGVCPVQQACRRPGIAAPRRECCPGKHHRRAHGPRQGHVPWTRVAEPGRGRRWALVTSGTKAFNFPALSGSYGIVGDPDARTEFVRRMETGEGLASPAVLSLTAHIAAYRQGAPWLDAVRAYVAGTLELVGERLASGLPELRWAPPQAGYLAWIDLRPLGRGGGESAPARSWWPWRRSRSCPAGCTATPRLRPAERGLPAGEGRARACRRADQRG
ncbi:hypothetical protein SCHAM137S_06563 [Streptomyces chartreusis]